METISWKLRAHDLYSPVLRKQKTNEIAKRTGGVSAILNTVTCGLFHSFTDWNSISENHAEVVELTLYNSSTKGETSFVWNENGIKHFSTKFKHCVFRLSPQVACCLCGWQLSGKWQTKKPLQIICSCFRDWLKFACNLNPLNVHSTQEIFIHKFRNSRRQTR